MADEMKTYKGFPREVRKESLIIDHGYDLLATQFSLDLIEALKKVPVEHHPRVGMMSPDDYSDAWGLEWWYYESDAEYEARWQAEQARIAEQKVQVRRDWDNLCTLLARTKTFEEGRQYRARMDRVLEVAKGLGVELPEPGKPAS